MKFRCWSRNREAASSRPEMKHEGRLPNFEPVPFFQSNPPYRVVVAAREKGGGRSALCVLCSELFMENKEGRVQVSQVQSCCVNVRCFCPLSRRCRRRSPAGAGRGSLLGAVVSLLAPSTGRRRRGEPQQAGGGGKPGAAELLKRTLQEQEGNGRRECGSGRSQEGPGGKNGVN